MSAAPSMLHGDIAVVRLLAPAVWLRGRRLSRISPYGSLCALPAVDALRLVESGTAKTPEAYSRADLREACGLPRRTGGSAP